MAQKLTGGIENFGGGLNTAKPAHQLAENEIRIAQWVDVGPDGARIDVSYTVEQLRALLAPRVPDDYMDGDPILSATWEALKAANPQDETLVRYCEGMIRAGYGEAWAPYVVNPQFKEVHKRGSNALYEGEA